MRVTSSIPKRDMSKSQTGCCPPFEPKDWDEKTFSFEDKLFMKVSTVSFLHIPINMNSVMRRAMAKIDAAGATNQEYLMLSDEDSPWKTDHYISVDKEVPEAEMVRLSGTYMAKVFEGPYKDAGKWHEQLIDYVVSKGATPLKTYFNYTMCPACSKFYGKNYVIGLEQIEG